MKLPQSLTSYAACPSVLLERAEAMHQRFTGFARQLGCLVCAVAAFACMAQPSQAFQQQQQFKQLNVQQPEKSDRLAFYKMVSSGIRSAQDALDRYFMATLAEFSDPAKQSELGDLRRQLKYNILQRAGRADDESVHKYLNQKVLDVMGPMTGKEYHPFVRVNAMLVIGDLNAKEIPLNGREKPVPSIKALATLLDNLEDVQQLEGVKAAALVGLDRHVSYGIPGSATNEQKRVYAVLMDMATGQTETHPFLRQRAVRALGHYGATGEGAAVPKLMLQMMSDRTVPMKLRCEAGRAIGNLYLERGPRVDTPPDVIAHMLGELLVQAARETGPGNRWTFEGLLAMRYFATQIEHGLQGPDPRVFKPVMHGLGAENDPRGLKFVANEQQKKYIEAMATETTRFMDGIFKNDDIPNSDISELVDSLERYLEATPPPSGGRVAGNP